MKIPVEHVRLDELCPAGEQFQSVIGVAPGAVPKPFWLLGEIGWRREMVPRLSEIGPLGLSCLQNVTVCGSGYVFSNDRFVLEEAHTSRVALQWLENGAFPDNPFTTPPVNEILVEQPGLIVFGPGFPIWGHVMLDYLPRIALAQQALGKRFKDHIIPVPADSPEWLFEALQFFCGIKRDHLLFYDRHCDKLVFRQICLPSFAHGGEHEPHPFMTRFYRSFVSRALHPPARRLCLSRRKFEKQTRSAWRVYEGREAFEKMAVERGYDVVCPEDFTLSEQIALFADASHLVGEYGSGMHNAIFCRPGTRIGCFPLNNAIQVHIADAGGHHLSAIGRSQNRVDDRGVVFFDVAQQDVASLFDRLETDEQPASNSFAIGCQGHSC